MLKIDNDFLQKNKKFSYISECCWLVIFRVPPTASDMSRLSIFLLLSLFEFFSSNYGLIINSNDNKKILSKIVNGEKADIKEFPYLVSIS